MSLVFPLYPSPISVFYTMFLISVYSDQISTWVVSIVDQIFHVILQAPAPLDTHFVFKSVIESSLLQYLTPDTKDDSSSL